jgi:hypothetical protein
MNGSRSGSWDPKVMAILIDEAMRYVGEKKPHYYKPSADEATKVRGHIRTIEQAIAAKDSEEVKARVDLLVKSMLGHHARPEWG